MENLEGITTASMYFRATDPNEFGRRLPAGTPVTIKETRRGMRAMYSDPNAFGLGFFKIVSMDQVTSH